MKNITNLDKPTWGKTCFIYFPKSLCKAVNKYELIVLASRFNNPGVQGVKWRDPERGAQRPVSYYVILQGLDRSREWMKRATFPKFHFIV